MDYINFLFFYLLVCTCERACYWLDLRLSYAIILHALYAMRFGTLSRTLPTSFQRFTAVQPSWRSLFDLLMFCLFGVAAPHQSFVKPLERRNSSHEVRAHRGWLPHPR